MPTSDVPLLSSDVPSFGGQTSATVAWSRAFQSCVAGFVSFLVTTIMGISFGMLVFGPVPGGVALGIQNVIIGVNVLGNAALALTARLPCVVVTADNGVVAPIVASVVARLAQQISDPDELLATSMAGVAIACTVFGLVQLLLVRLNLVRLVQYLPYSIPMGFLSGIGLELCSAISLAGCLEAQASAVVFAAVLCLGSWWRGWPLAVLFPALLTGTISAFYILGAPDSWLLEIEESSSNSSFVGLWAPSTLRVVHWDLLVEVGKWQLGVLCLLGCLQNCLFAGLFSCAPGVRVTPNQVLLEFSTAYSVGGMFGFVGGFHNMACFSLSRELRSNKRAPGGITAALSALLWFTGLGPVLRVPRFVFAGLLLWVGLKFLRTYLVQPALMLPRTESAVIVCVAAIMKVGGFSTGVLAGLVLALVSMVSELAALKCVQHVSYLHEVRSNAVRSVRAEQLLLRHGHEVLVLRLAPGFVFFATSAEILEIVENQLHVEAPPWQAQDPLCAWDESDSDVELSQPVTVGTLTAVVIDFTLCRGFDGSLVGVLQQIAALGLQHKFKLQLAGLRNPQLSWLKSNTPGGVCSFFPDLDRTLESVENELLDRLGMTVVKEQSQRCLSNAAVNRRLSKLLNVSDLLSATSGWALLFVYSDCSAASRRARPAVAQAMSLLEGRCDFFEASAEEYPDIVNQFGLAPALILLHRGELKWSLDPAKMAPRPQAGVGSATLPSARYIALEVEQRIRAIEAVTTALSPTSTPGCKRAKLSKDSATWQQFLELAGMPIDGPLAALSAYVRGPRSLLPGEVLLHKGEAPSVVFFILNGLLSLWNEGRGHDEDAMLSAVKDTAGSQTVQLGRSLTMLSGGTSRLLRIGPGWVVGANTSVNCGLRPPLAPLTCMSATEVQVFELHDEDAQRLQVEDLNLKLALNELLMHFSAVIVQHMAVQLSDWHTLAYARQEPC